MRNWLDTSVRMEIRFCSWFDKKIIFPIVAFTIAKGCQVHPTCPFKRNVANRCSAQFPLQIKVQKNNSRPVSQWKINKGKWDNISCCCNWSIVLCKNNKSAGLIWIWRFCCRTSFANINTLKKCNSLSGDLNGMPSYWLTFSSEFMRCVFDLIKITCRCSTASRSRWKLHVVILYIYISLCIYLWI